MEDELNGVVPCSSLAVESTIRVGTAGALWGLCMGPCNSRKNGLSGVDHAAFVLNVSIAGAVAGAAIATRTRRSWSQVVGMAALVSAFSAAAEYSRSL